MKSENTEKSDLEVCRDKILDILAEYNCEIQSDDYHAAWLYDNDTSETVGFNRNYRID